MASERVLATEVQGIIPTSLDPTPFIATANLIVEEELLGKGHTQERLTMIELYLACHFTAIAEERGGLVRSAVGDAAETYADIYSVGFASTRFGQVAIQLDSTGTLANMNSVKLRALFAIDVPAFELPNSSSYP